MADGSSICPKCGKASSQATAGGAAAAPAAAASTSDGLSDNLAGLLAYVTFIPAIIFLVVEPYNKNKFVRFHAFQSIILAVASIVIHIVLMFIPVIGWILSPFVGLAILVLAIVAAVKAYGGNKWHIPVIGPMAEKQADA